MGEEQRSLTHHHSHHEMGRRHCAGCHWDVSLSWNWGPLLCCLPFTKSPTVTLPLSLGKGPWFLLKFVNIFLISPPLQGTHSVVWRRQFNDFFLNLHLIECFCFCSLLRKQVLRAQVAAEKNTHFNIQIEQKRLAIGLWKSSLMFTPRLPF